MSDLLPQRRAPVHQPISANSNRPAIVFVTVCTKDRQSLLATTEAHALLIRCWQAADHFAVGRYVIMPDHVHLFCAPNSLIAESLPRWISYWKSVSAQNWQVPNGKLWQRDYWDTQLRTGDSYSAKWDYVRMNPVRAGLVTTPEAWEFQGELNVLRWHN